MTTKSWITGPILATALITSCAAGAGGTELGKQMQHAAQSGDSHHIEALLKQGANIEAPDADGRTPLLLAIHSRQADAARALMEAGADVNAKDTIQDSPYLYAGASGQTGIVQMTIAHGAGLRSTNRYSGTALIPAAERGHVSTVQALIEAGVEIDHINNLGWTALLETIILGDGSARYVEITELLIAAGADVNLADGEGVTPPAHSRKHQQTAIEQLLRDAGAR